MFISGFQDAAKYPTEMDLERETYRVRTYKHPQIKSLIHMYNF